MPHLIAILPALMLTLLTATATPSPESLGIEDKVGQLLMVADKEITPDQVRRHGIGAILLHPANPERQAWETPADYRAHLDRYGPAWIEPGSERLPLLFGVDAVHGHALIPGATVFPHNIGLAGSRDPELLRAIGRATAAEVAATGFNWILAPSVGSSPDPRWGRTYEGWGMPYDARKGLVDAFIDGVREATSHTGRPVLTCAKHFLADGEPTWGTGKGGTIDQGDVRLSEAALRERHLPPYIEAIEAGADSIMVSYGS